MSTANRLAAKESVTRLILAYCSEIDAGRLDGMAELFSKGTWYPSPRTPLKGRDQVAAFLNTNVILYDGVPRTRHVTTNIRVDLAEDGKSASAESYMIIYQSAPGSGPQIIVQGAYADKFFLDDGQWFFDERHVTTDGMGDTSNHIRARG